MADGTPSYRRDGTPQLDYHAMIAGRPCHGCRRPLVPRRSWRYDDDAFRTKHWGHGGYWRMEGAQPSHCADCCPPPPLSDATLERIAELLATVDRSTR